jgi:hypothetical protein
MSCSTHEQEFAHSPHHHAITHSRPHNLRALVNGSVHAVQPGCKALRVASSAATWPIKSCVGPIGSLGVAVSIIGRSGNGRSPPAVGGARSLSEGPKKSPALRMLRLRCAKMLATPVFSHKACYLYTWAAAGSALDLDSPLRTSLRAALDELLCYVSGFASMRCRLLPHPLTSQGAIQPAPPARAMLRAPSQKSVEVSVFLVMACLAVPK